MNYTVDENGYFGEFGGAYVPEMLHKNISDLAEIYREILASSEFDREFRSLLRDYVGRPTPLYPALRLSEHVGLPVFLKREDLNHTGSHKINNTIGQALLARHLKKERIICETGAGQHGVATATVCALLGLRCVVYMGEIDTQRQAPNVERMRFLGATVVPVRSGSRTLKDATNEALRDWIAHPKETHYIIGSAVGPHPFPDMVARFQSVISEELLQQCDERGIVPSHILACVGGGSNSIGAFYHYLDRSEVTLIGVEAAGKGLHSGCSAATTALGKVGVLHGSKTLVMQTGDGQIVEAHSISAGLDYPGIGPQHAFLHHNGRVRYVSVTDEQALEAAFLLSRKEGIVPALESAHALAYLPHIERRADGVVIVCLSGRGDKDMQSYLNKFPGG